jgi:hypothetical protein
LKKIFFYSILFSLSFSVLGQTIEKSKVIEDLLYLEEMVNAIHPSRKYDTLRYDLTSLRDSVNLLENDFITYPTFRFIFEKAIQFIGCAHTHYEGSTKMENDKKASYLPIRVFYDGNALWTNDLDSLNPYTMDEIYMINGVYVGTIFDQIKSFLGSDGGSSAISDEFLSCSSSILISMYFNYPEEFDFYLETGVYKKQASDSAINYVKPKFKGTIIQTKNQNHLSIIDSNKVLLSINGFSPSDKSFYRKAFRYIEKHNIDTILLDLRGNLGGSRKTSAYLARFLIHHDFQYRILNPKNNVKPYLNKSAKRNLFWANVLYRFIHKNKRITDSTGVSYIYSYKSKSKYFYNIFVLTDGYTASSSTMLVTWLTMYTDAIFIGRQCGGGYNGNNGGVFPVLELPNTGVRIKFPLFRVVLDEDNYLPEGLTPDVFVPNHLENIIYAVDPDYVEFLNQINDF